VVDIRIIHLLQCFSEVQGDMYTLQLHAGTRWMTLCKVVSERMMVMGEALKEGGLNAKSLATCGLACLLTSRRRRSVFFSTLLKTSLAPLHRNIQFCPVISSICVLWRADVHL